MKSGIKFAAVGGISTFTDFIIYMLISTRIPISISKAISMSVSCTVSFFLNRKWTFEVRERYSLTEIMKYIAVQMVNIGVNVSGNKWIYEATKQKIIAFVCATFIAMCVNYCLQRFVVFRKL